MGEADCTWPRQVHTQPPRPFLGPQHLPISGAFFALSNFLQSRIYLASLDLMQSPEARRLALELPKEAAEPTLSNMMPKFSTGAAPEYTSTRQVEEVFGVPNRSFQKKAANELVPRGRTLTGRRPTDFVLSTNTVSL